MVKCDYCGKAIDYLPFRCKYCGKMFCKTHRLPENHECSFEFKEEPFLVKRTAPPETEPPPDEYDDLPPIYSEPIEEPIGTTVRGPYIIERRPFSGMLDRIKGTLGLVIGILITYILALFPVMRPLIYMSVVNYMPPAFFYWTFLTATVTPGYPPFLIGVLFQILLVFLLGRSIEGRFGTGLFLRIYFGGALISALFIILFQLLFSLIPIYSGCLYGLYSASWGGIIALIAFISLLMPELQTTLIVIIIPIRMKMKHVLYVFIAFQLFFGLLSMSMAYPTYDFIENFAAIFGAIAGYIFVKKAAIIPLGSRQMPF